MNDNLFVQIVNNDGTLGGLYGPATWDKAIIKVKQYVEQRGPLDSEETLEQAFAHIDGNGCYEWEGSGIYIVQGSPIDAPLPLVE